MAIGNNGWVRNWGRILLRPATPLGGTSGPRGLLKPPLTAVSNNDSESGYIERNPSLNQGNLVLFLDSYHWPRMFSLKHRLFLSQQLTKHQRIHQKTHTPKTKKKQSTVFLAFTHYFDFNPFQKPKRINHRVEKSHQAPILQPSILLLDRFKSISTLRSQTTNCQQCIGLIGIIPDSKKLW